MRIDVNRPPRKLFIVGAGGLGGEYAWVAEQMNEESRRNGVASVPWEILGFVDDDPTKTGAAFAGYLVHGNLLEAIGKFGLRDIAFTIAIGSNHARERMAMAIEKQGWIPETLIHPSAIIASTAFVGPGSYLAPGTVVCPRAHVGRHVILNTHVSVGHDSTLGDFVQVCPGGRVSGGCLVGAGGFLGSNASIAPMVAIGEGSVVCANSFVVRKVAPRTTVLGCPAVRVATSRSRSAE
jgi:sugar O-acyltransferase (sialic acid O-acetyltransferase NeuD family)